MVSACGRINAYLFDLFFDIQRVAGIRKKILSKGNIKVIYEET